MEAAGDGERSSFRCLDAARYVLAAVMTVLVAAITFNTVKLILYEQSHDPVQLSLVRGTVVFVRRGAAARTAAGGVQPALVFYHSFRVSSARGFRYYLAGNITTCLLTQRWSENDERNGILCLRPGRTIKAVEQRGESYFLMEAKRTRDTINSSYFDALYNQDHQHGKGGGISWDFVSLRLEGTFITERRSGWNVTSRSIYYCGFMNIVALDGDEVVHLDRRDDLHCHM